MQDVLCIKRIELKHSARKGVKTMIHQLMCVDDTFYPIVTFVCILNMSVSTMSESESKYPNSSVQWIV